MPKIVATVKFEFDIEGTPPREAQESIREQIGSDCNEYYQNSDDRAQLERWEIVGWKLVE